MFRWAMMAKNPLKRWKILLVISVLALVILISAGCGDDGFIVISTGNGVIIFTPHSSSKLKTLNINTESHFIEKEWLTPLQ